MRWMRWVLSGVVGVAAAAGGCAKKGPPATQPAAVESASISTRSELEQKIQELRQRSAAFLDTTEQLASRGDQDHRLGMEQAFTELLQVLPLLAESQPDGGLAQRMRIIETSRDQLQNATGNLAEGPMVDTALRSAAGALENIARIGYADQIQVAEALQQLQGKIAELDTTRGAIHRLVATQCLGLMGRAVAGMSQVAIERWQAQIQAGATAGESEASEPPAAGE